MGCSYSCARTIPLPCIKPYKVYYIECENNAWYVGTTIKTLEERFLEHACNEDKCALWTRLNKPQKIFLHNSYDTRREACIEEHSLTLEFMMKYGIDNVRGGRYASPNINKFMYLCLKSDLAHVENLCYICLKSGHFAKHCKNNNPQELL